MITRQEVMNSPSVHFVVKDILKMTAEKDPVDTLKNLELCKQVVKAELDSYK